MAVPSVTITGSLVTPDGDTPSKGTIRCRLSQPGTALDGGSAVRVIPFATGSVTDGVVSLSLVPNDAITPSGTFYQVSFTVTLDTGRTLAWTENWQLASSPSPIDIGAVPRIDEVSEALVQPLAADISNTTVKATGSTTARAEKDRWADVVNVKDFGAKGDGSTDDTAAIQAAAAAGLNLFAPVGTYITDTVTLRAGQRIIGAGWFATVFKARSSTQSSVFRIHRDNPLTTGYGVEIASLRIRGQGDGVGTVHGIESTDANQGAVGLRVRDVWIDQLGGDGVHLLDVWSSTFDNVWVDLVGGHGFYVHKSYLATKFHECYAKSIGLTGKAGWRVIDGFVTLDNCNGIDRGQRWGIFGATDVLDGEFGDAHVTFTGCNTEDFTDTGIEIRNKSEWALRGHSFVAPASGTVRAFYINNTDSQHPGEWGANNRIITKGASWTNGYAIHWNFQSIVRTGRGTDWLSGWYVTGGFATRIPLIGMGDVSAPVIHTTGLSVHDADPIPAGAARVRRILTAYASLDFADTASGASTTLTVSVPGAADGDSAYVTPAAAVRAGMAGACGWDASVSAADTVEVRFWNAAGANRNPGGGNYRITVIQYYT
jgi:hypothetical protein